MTMQDISIPDGFPEWLAEQVGPSKWIVARKSAKRVKQGFELFLTQKRFFALVEHFNQETGMIETDELSKHLTEPNKTLGQQRRDTHPGQAFWAGTGPQGKTCRACMHWACDGYLISSGLLKTARCIKYRALMHGADGCSIPHYAKACKYFEETDTVPPLENPKR